MRFVRQFTVSCGFLLALTGLASLPVDASAATQPTGVDLGQSVSVSAIQVSVPMSVDPDAGILPPANPSVSVSPNPDFTSNGSCSINALDDSDTCNQSAVQAIDNARSNPDVDGLGSIMLASSSALSAYEAMTIPEQLFVIANLERADRGLTPMTGLTTQLDTVAETGAKNNDDPDLSASTLTGGATVISWGSNWAGGTSNPLGSDYYWMYDDGYPSSNGDCTSPTAPGCWGHRDNILQTYSTPSLCSSDGLSGSEQYMGAGYVANSGSFGPSFAEIFVGACGSTPSDVVFTWTQAKALLNGGGGGLTAQTITFTPPASGAIGGSATLSATGGGSGNPVVFSVDSKTKSGVCSVSGTNGSTVNYAKKGTCVIDANQAGNSTYAAAAQVSGSITVGKGAKAAPQTITFGSLANKTLAQSPVTVSATASSGLPVTFTTTTSTVCTSTGTNGATITLLKTGKCTVQANQGGNASYSPAKAVNQSFKVLKA